jgi:diguanylate cyclase (GGDEF)-like protein
MVGSEGKQKKDRNANPVLHGNCLPMWIYDRRSLRFLEVSEGAVRLYGYSREEFLAMTICDIGPIEELTRLECLDPASINGSHRWQHRRKDGTQFAVSINANSLIYDGQWARLVVARELDPTLDRADKSQAPADSSAAPPDGASSRSVNIRSGVSAPPVSAREARPETGRRQRNEATWLAANELTHREFSQRETARSASSGLSRDPASFAPSPLAGSATPAASATPYTQPAASRNTAFDTSAPAERPPGSRSGGQPGPPATLAERPVDSVEAVAGGLHDPAGEANGAIAANRAIGRIEGPDRLLLEERAEEALDHADRTRHRVAVCCLDLDNLEEVFERFGPEGAELCVEHVAMCLTRRLRGMDTIARTGTKTFTIILAELDDDFALRRVAEALLKIFAEPVVIEGQAFAISASIGVAVYPDDGFDLARLSRAAESAMHQARFEGGHRIAMFSLQLRERTELDAYMRETLQRGGFRLHYQPQYTPEGEISTLEALLRLPGKETGFISPELFIPIAEDTGMIEQLGMWVIEQASRQVREWHREYGRLAHVAVNVSPLQLRGPDFAERALTAIRSHGVVPASIEFEITERAVLNFDEVAEPMRKLSEAGIIFAVDDFGTGYSSLQHLHRLPISVLKIDRSFVQRVGVPEGADAIIEAIVSMAHSLGMRVVAEGVETQAQRFATTQMGCDSIQGFLNSAAVEASKIPGLMGWIN